MKDEILKYLEDFMIQTDWEDEKTPKQAKAIFTTLCFMGNIDADTKECDDILSTLYFRAALKELIAYDEFTNFMLELIV